MFRKRKTRKGKTRRPRRVRSEVVRLQNKVWELCKLIIRKKYLHTCYTCSAENLEGVHLQTGHMINKKALPYYLKWDIKLLRPQCPACNKTREGMGALFYRNMSILNGQQYVDDIITDYYILKDEKPPSLNIKINYLKDLIEKYKAILNE